MKFSNIRCFACQMHLEHVPNLNTTKHQRIQLFECPNVHCSVWYDVQTKTIVQYTVFIDRANRRYKIKGDRNLNQTRLLMKHTAGYSNYGKISWNNFLDGEYQETLLVPRFKELSFQDNTLQGDELFERLKTLLTFS